MSAWLPIGNMAAVGKDGPLGKDGGKQDSFP